MREEPDPEGVRLTAVAPGSARDRPNPTVELKVQTTLDAVACDCIARSPFLVLSTADGDGIREASPKGDVPGLVAVENEHALLIPDRQGIAVQRRNREPVSPGLPPTPAPRRSPPGQRSKHAAIPRLPAARSCRAPPAVAA